MISVLLLSALSPTVDFPPFQQAAPDPPASKVEVALERVPDGGIQPQAVAGADGTLHLLYYKGEAKAGDLYYVRRKGGEKDWSKPLRANSQVGSAVAIGNNRGGKLALGREGRVHVAWNGSGEALPRAPIDPEAKPRAEGGSPMLYARLNEAGDAFEPQRNLMASSHELDGGGAVAADEQGHVWVVWHALPIGSEIGGEEGRRVLAVRSNDDGKTFAAESVVAPDERGACACCGLDAAAARGELGVVYRGLDAPDERPMAFLASGARQGVLERKGRARWKSNTCPVSSFAIASAGRETWLLAYEQMGDVRWWLAPAPSSNLQLSGNRPTSRSNEPRKHPCAAIDAGGSVLLAWCEGMSWGSGGELRWELFGPDGESTKQTGRAGGVPAWSFVAVVAGAGGGFSVFY